MVGFPGETEEDFAELYEFVKEQRFATGIGIKFFGCHVMDGAKMPMPDSANHCINFTNSIVHRTYAGSIFKINYRLLELHGFDLQLRRDLIGIG